MHWVDVCGPPGAGKSTLCDPLWGPREPPIEDRLPPVAWHDFLNEITRLLLLIRPHPTLEAAVRMNNRSIRKMATVARMEHEKAPYVQTGLVQRGLGFGWRLNDMGADLNELRHYFRLMPVSIGVAVARCDPKIVEQRNRERELVKATAHENRAFMVPLMQPAIELALEVLNDRDVPIIEISTERPVDDARDELVGFAAREPFDAAPLGCGGEAPVLSAPAWWR